MSTTFDEFWMIYTSRCSCACDRATLYIELERHPDVAALCDHPHEDLSVSGPDVLSCRLPVLLDQILDWWIELEEAPPRRRRQLLSSWRNQHPQTYWNASGEFHGFRRWG